MNICLETLVMENNKNNSKLDTKEEQSKDTSVSISDLSKLHPHDEWNKSIYQHTISAVKKFIKNIFTNSNNNK